MSASCLLTTLILGLVLVLVLAAPSTALAALASLVGKRRFGISVRIGHHARVLVPHGLELFVEEAQRDLEPVGRRRTLRHRGFGDVETVLVHVNRRVSTRLVGVDRVDLVP